MFEKLLKCFPINLNCSVYLSLLDFSRAMWPRGHLPAHYVTLMGRFLPESRWLPHHTATLIGRCVCVHTHVHTYAHTHTHTHRHTRSQSILHALAQTRPHTCSRHSLQTELCFLYEQYLIMQTLIKQITMLMLLSKYHQIRKRSNSTWSTEANKSAAATWALIQMESDAAWCISIVCTLNEMRRWHTFISITCIIFLTGMLLSGARVCVCKGILFVSSKQEESRMYQRANNQVRAARTHTQTHSLWR